MDTTDIIMRYIPGTKINSEYRIQHCLDYVKKISERKGDKQHYTEFETKIRECQKGPCPYTVLELRDIADKIAPGMGQTGTVWTTAELVKKYVSQK